MKNPIVDNRIVNDITFATRLIAFAESVVPCSAMDEEERDYMLLVGKRLLNYQRTTATSDEEHNYFANLGKPLH